ncbi:22629_t:CDS:1, partial [Cetraspora pellucida]
MFLKVYIIFAIIVLALVLSTSSAPVDDKGGFVEMKSLNSTKIKRDANPSSESPDGAFYNMADLKQERSDFNQTIAERDAEKQYLAK